jgi:hypothetical protein
MTESRDEWIKKRAYSLWEEEGYPTGRDQHHWEQAMKERAIMETTAPHGLAVKPKAKIDLAAKTAAKSKTASKSNGAIPPVVATKKNSKKDVTAKL